MNENRATRSGSDHLPLVFAAEGVTSAGTTLLSIGIFFYTANVFGWDARRNFLLAASQGTAYACGALCANAVSSRFGRRPVLLVLHAIMAAMCVVLWAFPSHAVFVTALLCYSFTAAVNWPMLESLTAGSKTDAQEMSRRLGWYNIIWAATGAMAVLSAGRIIQWRHDGVFLTALLTHVVSLACLFGLRRDSDEPSVAAGHAHLAPEPELLHARTLALWLSRISLPAMYVVNGGLSAMLPLLPVMHGLSPAQQTLLGAMWMVARWLAFVVLTATVFWHTRPRLLLVAAAFMCAAFLVVTIPPSSFFGHSTSRAADLISMIVGQLVLGGAMGLIYTASLYFGMVLSDGSTEHGGYHEALIGLGGILGPGVGAAAQILHPGDIDWSIAAVATIVATSTAAALVASIVIRRRRQGPPSPLTAKVV
jgi:MFS family permease